ncbi:hypothetical protein ACFQ22_04400 [Lentilactobacillus raoultii]|uniref:Uncharacterized protein n=1 Tax=Lentilactobacillus raoultii TaxID=1987503 RepID=A0ABW3PGT3_9LACO|nr:hypothetical protein [Lentilactobacillus raoultii]
MAKQPRLKMIATVPGIGLVVGTTVGLISKNLVYGIVLGITYDALIDTLSDHKS